MMRQENMSSAGVINAIKETFGETIFENNILKRGLCWLKSFFYNWIQSTECIVHPAVKKHFKEWLLEHAAFPLVVYEAAILFESGNYKDFDWIISVCSLEGRIHE
jgi:dephospho-CoA kinase